MSLDIELKAAKIVSNDEGKTFQTEYQTVFKMIIPNELQDVAKTVGLYEPLWGKHESVVRGRGMSRSLLEGLISLQLGAPRLEHLGDRSGKTYKSFVHTIRACLVACLHCPEAIVEIKEKQQ